MLWNMQKRCLNMNKKSICIIPARGGSKRIPRKNIKEFCGKPIIAYSIDAALESELFDEVMVSTDDEGIAEVARRYGAKVPFMRSAKNSGDYATATDVLNEVLERYANHGFEPEWLCCLYATAPFVTSEKLRAAYELFEPLGDDCLCAVAEFGFPPLRAFYREGGKLVYRFPQYAKSRSQDLEPLYQDAGQFYYYGKSAIAGSSIHPASFVGYEIPQVEVQDIDTMADWEVAELKYRYMLDHV